MTEVKYGASGTVQILRRHQSYIHCKSDLIKFLRCLQDVMIAYDEAGNENMLKACEC